MIDYDKIESDFDCACQDVIKDLATQYKDSFYEGGPGKLDVFLDLIKNAFDKAEVLFIDKNKLSGDSEALRRIKQIAKKHAKNCLGYYGKMVS